MDSWKHPRKLEQRGHGRLWSRHRQTRRRDFSLSAGTDCFQRARAGDTIEGHPRRHSGLRLRADAQKSGAGLLRGFRPEADCRELDQVDPRPTRSRKCAAEIWTATSSTCASLTIFFLEQIPGFSKSFLKTANGIAGITKLHF